MSMHGFSVVALIGTMRVGCSKKETVTSVSERGPHHEHNPPHGGTPVALGREAFHLAFVRDATAGKLELFVMDDEFERFARIAAPSLEVNVHHADDERELTLLAVANSATGEKAGDTSLFEAQAECLTTVTHFDPIWILSCGICEATKVRTESREAHPRIP